MTPSTRHRLGELIDGLAGLPYGGEAVDQRTHALQTAWYAAQAEADDELILAAALHDIGRADPIRAAYPDLPHELAGAAFAERHVGTRAAWLIAQHVPAKRYLVATDPEYRDLLSPVSVRSLARQGGPMDAHEVAQFEAHPMASDAARLRRWDDAAKDPRGPELSLDDVLAAYDRVAATSSGAATSATSP
ncbi:MAG TPA: metal-dependent phosphohydrolase [Micromonosporaceae bacterium]|nr:metal-dependent phosphohydrolase [Micromonosporaceae bacterium]